MNNKLKNALGVTGLIAIVLTIVTEVWGVITYVSALGSFKKDY